MSLLLNQLLAATTPQQPTPVPTPTQPKPVAKPVVKTTAPVVSKPSTNSAIMGLTPNFSTPNQVPSATLNPGSGGIGDVANKIVNSPVVQNTVKTVKSAVGTAMNQPLINGTPLGNPLPNIKVKDAANIVKSVVQAPFKDIQSVANTLTGQKEFNPISSYTDLNGKQVPVDRGSFLLGNEPIPNLQGKIAGISKGAQGFGVPKGIADVGAIPLTAVAMALDFLPGGGGAEKKVAEEALVLTMKAKTVEEFTKLLDTATPELKTFIGNLIKDKNVPINSVADFFNQASKQHVSGELLNAVNAAKPLRSEQAALYKQTLSQRFTNFENTLSQGYGESGFQQAAHQMAGEMPKVQFEPLQINQDIVDKAFEILKNSDLPTPNKLSAYGGIKNMLEGVVPTESQLVEMKKVYGDQVIKALSDKIGLSESIVNKVINVATLPRTLMSTLDVSAPGRQGIFIAPSHPKDFIRNVKNMFGYLTSEKKFQEFYTALEQRPTYQLMTDHGVSFTNAVQDVTKNEEYFMSNMASKIPIYGKFVRASDRAYTGFLNNLRADVWDTLYKGLNDTQKANPKVLDDLSSFVNAATGRGDFKDAFSIPNIGVGKYKLPTSVIGEKIGGKVNQGAPLLNALFFAPRLIASRLSLLNPFYYTKLSPPIRKEAMKSAVAFVASGMTILGLAKLMGADVSNEPTNSDFGKIKIGNTRYDIWGGFQQYATFIARMIEGQTTSTTGKTSKLGEGYKPTTRLDLAGRFARGKLGPDVSFPIDLMAGTDLGGTKVTLPSAVANRVFPFMTQDAKDAIDEYGFGPGMMMALPTLWGTGVQTYGTKTGTASQPKASRKSSSRGISTKIRYK